MKITPYSVYWIMPRLMYHELFISHGRYSRKKNKMYWFKKPIVTEVRNVWRWI